MMQFWNPSLTVLKEEAIKRVGLFQRKVWCTVDKKIEISSIKEEWNQFFLGLVVTKDSRNLCSNHTSVMN